MTETKRKGKGRNAPTKSPSAAGADVAPNVEQQGPGRGESARRPSLTMRALGVLPIAALISFAFVMAFHTLIGVWPASSVVTMFYVLCVVAVWVGQNLFARVRGLRVR